MSDFTKAPKQILLDLINLTNPSYQMEEADVIIGAPTVTTENSRNTSVLISAAPSSPFDNSQTFYYNRLDLAAVFATLSTDFEKTPEVADIDDLVALINARWALNLTADDFTSSAFPTFAGEGGEQHSVTLTAKPGSLTYIGAGEVTLTLAKVDMADAFPNNVLDGYTYEAPQG